jgi:hypothetical protein
MVRLSRKFVAILLAVWLPLFSGYALADSIVMQNMGDGCPADVAQQVSNRVQHVSVLHLRMHHGQMAGSADQSACQRHGQASTCKSVCQLACSGYMASLAINFAETQPAAQSFTLSSTQFQSVTTAPLDPPPLARV